MTRQEFSERAQHTKTTLLGVGQTFWHAISGDDTWPGARRRIMSPVGIASLIGVVLVGLLGYGIGTARASGTDDSNVQPSGSGMNMTTDPSTANVPVATQTNGAQPLAFTTDSDGAKHFTMTAQQVMWSPVKGQRVLAWTLNGTVPGPTIHAVAGDHVRISIVNHLPEPTSIHWHGLLVPSNEDGVPGVSQAPIAAGATFIYDFTIHDDNYGTFAYHSHYDDLRQVGGGMYGAFLVDPKPGTAAAANEPKVQEDYLQIISEMGAYFVINGHSFPDTDVLHVHHGDMMRIRVINLGEMIHPMHLHGHNFSIIARDGSMLPTAEPGNTIPIAPGETADLLVYAWATPGSVYPFHCHILAHVMNPGQSMDEMGGLITLVQYDK
jgi:manganese oxidase